MNRNIQICSLFSFILLLVAACDRTAGTGGGSQQQAAVSPLPSVVASVALPSTTATAMQLPSTPTATASWTPSPTATYTPSPTPTPDPYAGLTIVDLAARSYGEGSLQVEETIHITDAFTRTLVSYSSDGLTVYGFMNVPFGEGPFPVALVLHGYIPPRQYGTIAYTTRYADWLARAGYLVIHPNYRNHPPSDETIVFAQEEQERDFRVGYAVDVLNLMALIETQGGQPGPLAKADPSTMHLMGHSMGGGITLRVITVNANVDAAVLYGSMSGDELKNYQQILIWSDGESGEEELATPPEDLQRIAPIYHLDRIQAPISIHHGALDSQVPPEWSTDLCQRLQALNKVVECFNYADQGHTFQDAGDQLFMRRVIDFFNRY